MIAGVVGLLAAAGVVGSLMESTLERERAMSPEERRTAEQRRNAAAEIRLAVKAEAVRPETVVFEEAVEPILKRGPEGQWIALSTMRARNLADVEVAYRFQVVYDPKAGAIEYLKMWSDRTGESIERGTPAAVVGLTRAEYDRVLAEHRASGGR